MTKLWSVTVNGIGMERPETIFAPSRAEAEKVAARYECSDDVEYAGNFSDRNAAERLAPCGAIDPYDTDGWKWWWDLWKAGKAPLRCEMTEAWLMDAYKNM